MIYGVLLMLRHLNLEGQRIVRVSLIFENQRFWILEADFLELLYLKNQEIYRWMFRKINGLGMNRLLECEVYRIGSGQD